MKFGHKFVVTIIFIVFSKLYGVLPEVQVSLASDD